MRILGEDAIASVQTMPACSSQDSIHIVASSRDALSYIQKVKLSFLLAGIFSLSILRTADSFVHPIFQYKDPDPAPCDEKSGTQ
mgnify:FL=1